MQHIPALRLSYGNLLLKELAVRGPATLDELLDVPDAERLFKSDRQHIAPVRRAQDVLRFGRLIGLVAETGKRRTLTDVGRAYVGAIRPDDPWTITEGQAAVLRSLLGRDDDSFARDTRLALAVHKHLIDRGERVSAEDFGRALARASHTKQWRETNTFTSQGARYRALLDEAGLVSSAGDLTPEGEHLLDTIPTPITLGKDASRPAVWWVNQRATYGKQRDGQFLWAPILDKAGRPQSHWDAMDDVARGDVILHYTSGFLRAVSIAQSTAQSAQNPLGTNAWERDGRIVSSRYRELNDPIALVAIPEHLRVPASGPFTSIGSVQQGYLYPVNEKLATELADRFPELREFLVGYDQGEPGPPAATVSPADLHEDFATAVEAAGLRFPPAGNLVRSFLSSLLTKPFAILTGLSGSGKTQLAMRLGEWFGQDDLGRSRSLVVPVRPDWTGPEALFGYEDALRSAEARGPVWFVPDPLAFILRAATDPTLPYLLILDEMNLAHVERYFADFLSGIESRKQLLPDLEQDKVRGDWAVRNGSSTKLPLPRNLFVVGTVNVDETTYMFSPKVLDRASTFEFRVEAAMLDPDLGRPSAAPAAPSTAQRAFCDLAEDDEWHRQNPHPEQAMIVAALREFHDILGRVDLEFGHRTFYESLRFAAFYAATGDVDVDHVLDLVVMQKLLPKLHGSRRRIEPVLTELLAVARGSDDSPRLPAAYRKLGRMLDAVRANQFVSFTE